MTTIFARSSGSVPAAIAIVRISGPQAGAALETLTARALPPPRMASVRTLRRGTDVLDRALVLWMPGPATATGEDLVELHLHGGRAVVAAVEDALAATPGLSAAEPGAFTRRAFDNGRLDATEVEGLADLLAAETEGQRVAALALAGGALRQRVAAWQARLLSLAARAEAQIDFDEEGDVGGDPMLGLEALALAAELRETLAQPPAERLRDGVRVVIAGPPNAGKSTLLNALAGRDAAIASPIAGTTRDVIEVPLLVGGVPVILIDTAGLRDAGDGDAIEAIGIARADAAIEASDLLLWLGDAREVPRHQRVIMVASKADAGPPTNGGIAVSAVTGTGVEALLALIVDRVRALLPARDAVPLLRRHRDLIAEAAGELDACALVADPVLVAEHLRGARMAFDRITGLADTEAMLDTLFGRFCLGK